MDPVPVEFDIIQIGVSGGGGSVNIFGGIIQDLSK